MIKEYSLLLAGFHRFCDLYQFRVHDLSAELIPTWNPGVMLVTCNDLRIDPELLLQAEPGELFVTRVAGGYVPAYHATRCQHSLAAAFEYGMYHLNVKHLVILGHKHCSAITTAVDVGGFGCNRQLRKWLKHVPSTRREPVSANEAVMQSLRESYGNALTYPGVQERVDESQLKVHMWCFDVKQLTMRAYNAELDQFEYV